MNILHYHKQLINNYKSYIQSFLSIKDPKNSKFVEKEINNKKLWPEPLIQFNPTFETGKALFTLINGGYLHKKLNKILTGFTLYKHQEEAIPLNS